MSGTGNPNAGERIARVIVADDQSMVREGIVLVLGLIPGIEVVGSARDGEEAVALTAELAPDVVLMDLRMPRCDGVEATRRIRAEHPGTEVVVLTTYADDDSLFPALRAGARGYLTKDAGGEEIVRAVHDVLDGRAGLAPSVQLRLLEQLVDGPRNRHEDRQQSRYGDRHEDRHGDRQEDRHEGREAGWAGASRPEPQQSAPMPDGLTEREAEVLAQVAEGFSNREIATHLGISTATVKTHINNLFAKTGARDRVQAVRYAYRHGLVRPPGGSVT
ncbi:response regulator transcription factor [Streptomyces sp. ISL-36]|uniref:response regulator transcription factor n=1 Tax=Streptomyces sp. ISL-36 TaxID=2819182 RepID=UPI001BE760B2|nr:response regulator transcription factor [Streptomyces sp. ISL-36]MBT2440605.1 response regulator transcription factor [Streptomyces sp. ISL-36]